MRSPSPQLANLLPAQMYPPVTAGEKKEWTLKLSIGCALALTGFGLYSWLKLQQPGEALAGSSRGAGPGVVEIAADTASQGSSAAAAQAAAAAAAAVSPHSQMRMRVHHQHHPQPRGTREDLER